MRIVTLVADEPSPDPQAVVSLLATALTRALAVPARPSVYASMENQR